MRAISNRSYSSGRSHRARVIDIHGGHVDKAKPQCGLDTLIAFFLVGTLLICISVRDLFHIVLQVGYMGPLQFCTQYFSALHPKNKKKVHISIDRNAILVHFS